MYLLIKAIHSVNMFQCPTLTWSYNLEIDGIVNKTGLVFYIDMPMVNLLLVLFLYT